MQTNFYPLAIRYVILDLLKQIYEKEDVSELLDEIARDPSEWGSSDFEAIAYNAFPIFLPKASAEERSAVKKAVLSKREGLVAALWCFRQESMQQMKEEFSALMRV